MEFFNAVNFDVNVEGREYFSKCFTFQIDAKSTPGEE